MSNLLFGSTFLASILNSSKFNAAFSNKTKNLPYKNWFKALLSMFIFLSEDFKSQIMLLLTCSKIKNITNVVVELLPQYWAFVKLKRTDI